MVDTNTPLHWGQKYEPLTVMIYEREFHTKVEDFGCIQHPVYKFLGASPDGIIFNKESERYGRMLEIKNVVSRDINGIPKKEYWIQMQLQMEVCDLDECDFLETRFKEYESEADFLADSDSNSNSNVDTDTDTDTDGFLYAAFNNESADTEIKRKGIIMYFANQEGNPIYLYKPLWMNKAVFDVWEQEKMEEMEKSGHTWIQNIYWKLEEYSCVLVDRNRKWFEDNIPQIKNVWDIIEKERINGFEHRRPNKRITKPITYANEVPSGNCLIKIKKLD
jgi:hypothetical protein